MSADINTRILNRAAEIVTARGLFHQFAVGMSHEGHVTAETALELAVIEASGVLVSFAEAIEGGAMVLPKEWFRRLLYLFGAVQRYLGDSFRFWAAEPDRTAAEVAAAFRAATTDPDAIRHLAGGHFDEVDSTNRPNYRHEPEGASNA